jgi:hypothetical protein
MLVLVCLIFSVLSTIEEYANFANETLFWMVSEQLLSLKNYTFQRDFFHTGNLSGWLFRRGVRHPAVVGRMPLKVHRGLGEA